MATALVQSKENITTGFAATKDVSFTSAVSAGSVLCAFVYMDKEDSPSLTGCTISDSVNGAWTMVDTVNMSDNRRIIATGYVKNSGAGSPTITITYTGATNFEHYIVIAEISGADATAPLDANAAQSQTGCSTATDNMTSGADTTTVDGCYVIALTGTDFDYSHGISRGTGFTTTIESNAGSPWNMLCEGQVQATAGSVAGTFTSDTGSSAKMLNAMMAFKPSGGGGGSTDAGGMLLSSRRNRLTIP